ncbi:flagella accessory protein C, partial [Halorubrum ezzemoulense]
ENRIDELENEVASLSSTVSTVRSENEEISNAVDDIQEDVRNLLDIYEMVTRGINPFVDDSGGFDSVAGGGEGSFGIFDDEDGGEEEDLDEDVANADADGFFDDDLLDEEAGAEADEFDDLDDNVDDGGFDDLDDDVDDGGFDDLDDDFEELDDDSTDDAASETETADEEDDMNDDGKSFSELKEEYDSGEADWAEEGDDAADEDPFDDGDDSFDNPGDETDSFDDGAADDGFGDDLGGDDLGAETGGDDFGEPADPEPARGAEPDPAPGRRPGGDPAEASGGFEYVGEDDLSGSGNRGKPYLTELPGDYVGDLLVMEWLEFLVSESDVTDAVRAINYYERIEWIGPDAAARLRDFLSGFGTIDRNLVDRPGTDRLVREHNTRSLRYVTQRNGTSS